MHGDNTSTMSTKRTLSYLVAACVVMLAGCSAEMTAYRRPTATPSPDKATIVGVRGDGVRGGPAFVTVDREKTDARTKQVYVDPGYRRVGVSVEWSNRFRQEYELRFVARRGRVYEVVATEADYGDLPPMVDAMTTVTGIKLGTEVIGGTVNLFAPQSGRPTEHECFLWVREVGQWRKLAGIAPRGHAALFREEQPEPQPQKPAVPQPQGDGVEQQQDEADGQPQQPEPGQAEPVEQAPEPAAGETLQVKADAADGAS